MNKKLVVLAALVFGVAGLMIAQTVKAQDAAPADNSAMANSDNSAMNDENSMAPEDNAAAPAENAAAPAAQ